MELLIMMYVNKKGFALKSEAHFRQPHPPRQININYVLMRQNPIYSTIIYPSKTFINDSLLLVCQKALYVSIQPRGALLQPLNQQTTGQ